MSTVCIIDYKKDKHFIQNVVAWYYAKDEFIFTVSNIEALKLEMLYEIRRIGDLMKVLVIDARNVERLSLV